MPKDVKAFVSAFERKMHEIAKDSQSMKVRAS
jgi:hypothetical protein